MVRQGRVNLNDVTDPVLKEGINQHLLMPPEETDMETAEIVIKIEYLLDHPKLYKAHPEVYDITLNRLLDRYFEQTNEPYHMDLIE